MEKKRFIIILIFIASLTFGITHVQYFEPSKGFDAVHYFYMSENPSKIDTVPAPFKYRILTPILVAGIKNLTNMPTWRAFYLLNYTMLFFSSVVLFMFLRKLGFNDLLGLIGVSIFLSNYIIVGLSVFLVDPLFFLLYIAGIYSILIKKPKYMLLCVALGILNKEAIILLIPFYLIMRFSPYIAYGLLPLLIPYSLWFDSVNNLNLMIGLVTDPLMKIKYAATSFSLLWLLAPFGYKNSSEFVKKSVFFLPFIFALWFFATNIDRMTFLSFPIVIPLVLQVIKDNFGKIAKNSESPKYKFKLKR